MVRLVISIIVASLFWFVMFSPWTSPYVNFWYMMLGATGVLTAMSLWFGKDWKKQFSFSFKDIALGLLSAIFLYGVFYIGNELSTLLFDFSRPQVDSVYAMRDGESKWFLALALLFWIGPAEEIFWRGYVQREVESRKGTWKAFIITTLIYAFVHIWAFNFMLFMAALICGAFWGLMYTQKKKNLLPLVISHAVWDVAIFILFPIM